MSYSTGNGEIPAAKRRAARKSVAGTRASAAKRTPSRKAATGKKKH
jgi:hypothetical protein